MKAEQRFPGPAFIYTVFLPRATEFLVSSKRRGVCLAQAQSLSADREPCPSEHWAPLPRDIITSTWVHLPLIPAHVED